MHLKNNVEFRSIYKLRNLKSIINADQVSQKCLKRNYHKHNLWLNIIRCWTSSVFCMVNYKKNFILKL